ncbi:hypothetical protein Bca52824_018800 [Brassica carinata]|uniref:Uncharacterized protein n=1 Tax=Brassica carinata TaxID=52824 RepID=A0A8X7VPJ5_BRACI|nr:hypothetical protein Bca52824_018800 [Brassica carinata]
MVDKSTPKGSRSEIAAGSRSRSTETLPPADAQRFPGFEAGETTNDDVESPFDTARFDNDTSVLEMLKTDILLIGSAFLWLIALLTISFAITPEERYFCWARLKTPSYFSLETVEWKRLELKTFWRRHLLRLRWTAHGADQCGEENHVPNPLHGPEEESGGDNHVRLPPTSSGLKPRLTSGKRRKAVASASVVKLIRIKLEAGGGGKDMQLRAGLKNVSAKGRCSNFGPSTRRVIS